jgi:hypothetical protein
MNKALRGNGSIAMKLRGEGGESRWVAITPEQFTAVRSVFQDVPDGHVRVTRVIPGGSGTCVECGNPAEFISKGDRLCGTDAAMRAVDGDDIRCL